jgi:beta-lactamase class A
MIVPFPRPRDPEMRGCMRRRLTQLYAAVATLCVVAPTACAPAGVESARPATPLPPQAFDQRLDADGAIRAAVRDLEGEYGIALIDIETGRSMGVNEHLVMHAASTMKVPVLLELYRRVAAGQMALDSAIVVQNRFRSIADSAHYYSLGKADDSEHTLYDRVGETVSLRELGRLMIVRSSNLATNILIDLLGAESIRRTTERVGGHGMTVLRGVEDIPAFEAGMNNTTTAMGLARVLAAIARCDILPRDLCDELIEVLAAQEFNEMIPAGLPPRTRVAHKTGWITGISHDGAIIYPEDGSPYVLVVLTRGAPDTLAARTVARTVASLSFAALGPQGGGRPRWSAASRAAMQQHARHRLPAFPAPTLAYDEYWSVLRPLIDATPALASEEIGRSSLGRPIRLVRAGSGPVTVLFWSQMHGDETTASRALADLFNTIALQPDDERVRRWLSALTILAVPMLNPDGADAHRRRSEYGVDINRDARSLATPEGRVLRQVQQRYRPQFGFNLHDQNPRSRVGRENRTAAIALLAPRPDEEGTRTPSFERAIRLTAHIARAAAPFVGTHLTRYDDAYSPRAFGDGMQSWGVSTVLIETGSWARDEPKHYLRMVNYVLLCEALDAIADGVYEQADERWYTGLPENGSAMNDLLIRGGTVVLPGMEPVRADISIDAAAVGGPPTTRIVDIGDLSWTVARDTVDAAGLFIHAARMQPGAAAQLQLRRSVEPESELIWEIDGTRLRRLTAR